MRNFVTSPYRSPATIAFMIALIFLVGCGGPSIVRYTPSFEYTPPKEAKQGASNVTIAIVAAHYPTSHPMFQRFGENLSKDFFQILTARGYTVRGPFRTYDEMTFPDKKGSDLVLIPELQIDEDTSGLSWHQGFTIREDNLGNFSATGNISIKGRIHLVVAESLSREKMWTKSVEIPPITIPFETTKTYLRPGPLVGLLQFEDVLYNDVAKALEAQYKVILEKTYQYLDPEEMQIVKKQAQEIRNKKVY